MDLLKGPPKILIADDNVQNVELLEAYLSDVECEIQAAFDGEETLRAVAEFAPDLLLLDVMMPRLSGFEVCRKLKSETTIIDRMIVSPYGPKILSAAVPSENVFPAIWLIGST